MKTHAVICCKDPYALLAYRLDCLKYVGDVMSLDSIDLVPSKVARVRV